MKYLAFIWCCWLAWLPVTFWFGRLFCRYVCPLGLSQSALNWVCHPKTHVRRVCTRLPRPWYQRAFNFVFLLLYFTLPLGVLLHPWGVFGRVLIGFLPGIVFFALILAAAAFGRGRLWCNWVCPLGTLFDLVAKAGWHQDKITPRCKNCRACFEGRCA